MFYLGYLLHGMVVSALCSGSETKVLGGEWGGRDNSNIYLRVTVAKLEFEYLGGEPYHMRISGSHSGVSTEKKNHRMKFVFRKVEKQAEVEKYLGLERLCILRFKMVRRRSMV